MKYLFKCTFLLLMIGRFSITERVSQVGILVLLIFTASNIFREKYNNSKYLILAEFVLVCFGGSLDPYFLVLNGIIAFDLFYMRLHHWALPLYIAGLYYIRGEGIAEYIFFITICAYFAHISRDLQEKNESMKSIYDIERRYRYELEDTRNKLVRSSREVAHIAEVKERNRIAREIHDNVGHSIAGVLFQLQASYKLRDKDGGKSHELLKKSIDELSASLELLRDTVHNIKPRESLGVEYIKGIIDNFTFCPVDFKFSGDFASLDANQVELLATNIKEALTNASKYSCASKVDISIDINEKFTRLYIKDNGIGCTNIKDNLGLSGMKERVKNLGGTISFSGNDGFLIVCITPRDNGGGVFENINN